MAAPFRVIAVDGSLNLAQATDADGRTARGCVGSEGRQRKGLTILTTGIGWQSAADAEPASILWEGHPLEYRLVDGELWMTGGSVCHAAGLANVSKALSRLDDDEKGKGITSSDTLGGNRQCVAIPKSFG
jgi:hypothetical protein